jgi:hypothetical protein
VLREARFLGRLNHPHIVRILDSGIHHGQPYLMMEWIAGGSLHERLRQGPLSIADSAQLGEQLASALEAVHAVGIVHRDLKPANVLLDERDATAGRLTAKLTDFGIARDAETDERLTSTGMILGTPQYMSPEQTGLSPDTVVVGPASDIYGVGAVLFACLTGQAPHPSGENLPTLLRVARHEPPPPRTLRSDIPIDLETIVVKCLRRNPAERYRSAGELAEDLRNFLRGLPISARPYTPVQRVWSWGQRHPVLATAIGMLGLMLVSLVGGGLYHLRSNRALIKELASQRDLAKDQEMQARRAAQLAEEQRDEAVNSALSATQALLAVDSNQQQTRRGILESIREKLLAESQVPQKLTVQRAEHLGGTLLNLTMVERRDSLLEIHQEDSARIVMLARHFPQSPILRRSAAQSLIGLHELQMVQGRRDAAGQTLQTLISLGELEPNELIGRLQVHRNQAHAEHQSGQTQRAWDTLDEACRLAGDFFHRSPGEHHRMMILLDLQFQRSELTTRLPTPTPEEVAFAPWRETLQRLRDTPVEQSLEAKLWRQRALHSLIEQPLSFGRKAMTRTLLDETRAEVETAEPRQNPSAAYINLRLDRAGMLLRLAPELPPTPAETEELRLSLDGARQFLRQHPPQTEIIAKLSGTLLFLARRHLAEGQLGECEATCHEVLGWLTPLGVSPAPFPGLPRMVFDAHIGSADALRGSPRIADRRRHLELACQFADDNARPAVALELLKLLLMSPDLSEAERVLAWIPSGHPLRTEAVALVDAVRNRQQSNGD